VAGWRGLKRKTALRYEKRRRRQNRRRVLYSRHRCSSRPIAVAGVGDAGRQTCGWGWFLF